MSIIGHIFASLFRAFFKILFTAIILAIIAGGLALGAAYTLTGHNWPPSILTDITAGVIAVLAAYAGGLTVLVQEAVRGVKTVERDVAKDVR
ncbi:MAG TPA: hypothetical protein VKQ36_02125 [Ktedonobacterales bacterium]|nr:hypothetical protein [Ktedonobacterales bacterium]